MGGGVATDTRGPATAAAPPAAPASAAHYRPQLDGLRAVAVYLVVAYHAGLHDFSGGFIGVDLFFVLSGYLVTQLLLRDFRTAGRIDFRRFYSRRFRRLLPAAFAALVVTAAVYTAIAAPADVSGARGGFRASFLYFANWHFISQSNDYFAANVNSNPVVHFWSLAVEEQFYVCWPLLLTGVYLLARRAGERQWKVVRAVIAAGFVVSMVAALHLSSVNLNRAYYGTDTRAFELLAGALLAITPRAFRVARRHPRAVRALAPASLAALVLLATPAIHLGQIQRGLAATVASCALILALEISTASWATRLLSTPSAVYLGRISYGTYLWHWPVIVIATQRFQPNAISLFALTCLVGTGLASLSFQVLEQRVRLSRALDRARTPVIVVGLATSLIGGLVVIPVILGRERSSAATSAATLGSRVSERDTRVPVPRDLHLERVAAEKYGRPDCYHDPVTRCIVTGQSGPRVLLIGDSHAQSLIRAFAGVAHRYRLTLAIVTSPNCPWERGLVEEPLGSAADRASICHDHQDDWYGRVIPQFDPDIVVLVHHALDDPSTPSNIGLADGGSLRSDTPEFENAARAAVADTIDALRRRGRKIVIIEPLPVAPGIFNPFICLSGAKYLDECRYVATVKPTPLERYFRTIADGSSVYSIDLDRLVCPYLPICDPIVNGIVVKKDKQHITAAFSGAIAGPVGTILAQDGIISAAP